MKYMMVVDPSKCTGCEMCVDVCSARKTGSYTDRGSRISVEKDEFGAVFTPLVCRQCPNHPCSSACPLGAVRFSEDLSIYQVDEETCTGCGACVEACPVGGISVTQGKARKCDLCGGDPSCVKVCYPQALGRVETAGDTLRPDREITEAKRGKYQGGVHE